MMGINEDGFEECSFFFHWDERVCLLIFSARGNLRYSGGLSKIIHVIPMFSPNIE